MLVSLILILANAAASSATLPPDLAKSARDYDQAQFSNDVSTLGALVTEDFVLVNSNASVENKEQFLADFRLPGFKIDPYRLEEPMYKVWQSGAVIAGLVHLHWNQDGQHQTRALRVVYVWLKSKGVWQVTYAQVTRAT